jgi:hypothetical protein
MQGLYPGVQFDADGPETELVLGAAAFPAVTVTVTVFVTVTCTTFVCVFMMVLVGPGLVTTADTV